MPEIVFYLFPRRDYFALFPVVDVIGVIAIEGNSQEKWKKTLFSEAFKVIDISYCFRASLCMETVVPQKLVPGFGYICFSLRFPSSRKMFSFLNYVS